MYFIQPPDVLYLDPLSRTGPSETLSFFSSCRVGRHQDELQQPADDVPRAGQQPWLQRGGGLQLLYAASPGRPGLLQHPEGHRLCQDDPWLQVCVCLFVARQTSYLSAFFSAVLRVSPCVSQKNNLRYLENLTPWPLGWETRLSSWHWPIPEDERTCEILTL